jgi:PncC family amidohydrolase
MTGDNDIKLSSVLNRIQNMMVSSGKTLSTAESCTGGGLASLITSIPGSSEYFQGALVAYQNHIKIKMLSVSPETIERFDVVSENVVAEMVKGACKLFATDYAIATSGYAGPGKGSDKVPVGTICIAFGNADDQHTLTICKDNGRSENVRNAVSVALNEFYEYLSNKLK